MSSPLDQLEVTSPPLDHKDLLPIVDDPLAEQVPQTIVAPPPPMPASASRGRRQTKKKRKRVGRACVFCQRSHMSCDDSRPCKRCVARGCADQCRDSVDPDGKRKRRGRKRKTAAPDEDGSGSSSSGEEDLEVGNPSETLPIGISRSKHHHHHHDSDLGDQFGASLDGMSQGSRPFFITKPKRAKLREEFDDDSDLDDVPHLAGPTSHFGVHHMHHHHFDEDEHVSAIGGGNGNGNSGSSSAAVGGSSVGTNGLPSSSSASGPMAVPRAKRTGSVSGVPGAHHDDFAHFNIYPELLTLPSPVSGSHQHAHMWFPSPRNTNGGPLLPGGSQAGHHPFEMGDAHFVASPIISGLAHSFGANSCGSTSYLNTPNGQKGFHDFYPSGSSDHQPSFDGFIL